MCAQSTHKQHRYLSESVAVEQETVSHLLQALCDVIDLGRQVGLGPYWPAATATTATTTCELVVAAAVGQSRHHQARQQAHAPQLPEGLPHVAAAMQTFCTKMVSHGRWIRWVGAWVEGWLEGWKVGGWLEKLGCHCGCWVCGESGMAMRATMLMCSNMIYRKIMTSTAALMPIPLRCIIPTYHSSCMRIQTMYCWFACTRVLLP